MVNYKVEGEPATEVTFDRSRSPNTAIAFPVIEARPLPKYRPPKSLHVVCSLDVSNELFETPRVESVKEDNVRVAKWNKTFNLYEIPSFTGILPSNCEQ